MFVYALESIIECMYLVNHYTYVQIIVQCIPIS